MALRYVFWFFAALVILAIAFSIWVAIAAASKTKRAEAEFPPSGQFLTIDGARVHYTDNGTGPAVILLHGAGGSLRDWTYSMIPELSKTHRVIAFDRAGHGYSSTFNSSGETLAEQADILHKASQALNVSDAIIVGYSFGGAVSLKWALDQRDFVKGLVVVSAVSNPWPGGIDALYHILAAPILGKVAGDFIGGLVTEQRINDGYRSVFRPQTAPEPFIEHAASKMSVRPKAYRANAKQVVKMKPQIIEQSQYYADLQTPIEILHGVADPSVPFTVHAVPLHAKAPNTRLTELEGMGHAAHILAQDEIIAAVKRLSK